MAADLIHIIRQHTFLLRVGEWCVIILDPLHVSIKVNVMSKNVFCAQPQGARLHLQAPK